MIGNVIAEVKKDLENKTADEKIDYLNSLRSEIQKLSPQTEPVDTVRWVRLEDVQSNAYNPNRVAQVEMKLLYTSVLQDGYTMPIVCYDLGEGKYEIVDGFHRSRVCREYDDIKQRTHGRLPITIIDKPLDERMGSTVRHNRARGTHQINSMTSMVVALIEAGWSDDEICKKLGMDQEEVLRFKQVSGLKEAFANHEFSKSWEEFESNFIEDNITKMQSVKKTVAVKGYLI